MKLSVERKIRVLVYLPVALILILSSIIFYMNYEKYQSAKKINIDLATLSSMSELVGNLQKERGMSATYLSGGLSLDTLQSHRGLTSKLIGDFKKSFLTSSYSSDGVTINYLSSIDSVRSTVDSRGSIGTVLRSYTEIIYNLLSLYEISASDTTDVRFERLLVDSMVVEEAKENSGKLRANMSKVLAVDEAISKQTLTVLLKYKAGVDVNLNSPALLVDAETASFIKNFYSSQSWKKVNDVFATIVSKMNEGGYGHNASQFFSTITISVGQLGNLVKLQTQNLKNEVEHEFSRVSNNLIYLVFGIFLGLILLVVLSIKISSSITKPLIVMTKGLDEISSEVNCSSADLLDMGRQLTAGATSQAAAIEETSASLEELVSIVGTNQDYAESSAGKTRTISEISKDGKKASDTLLEAMKDIKKSNESISNIVGLIGEIADKTKLIDEIVFQTKLLSFNASVEAERAGEHGRGFAVVAQEVGNLAQMSGNTAAEISEIVSKGVIQVKQSIKENSDKVNAGSKVAEDAANIFESIDKHSAEAASMSEQILVASTEQNLGLQQINEAVTMLDQNTQKSVIHAETLEKSGEELSVTSNSLGDEVHMLVQIVRGES